MMCRMSFRPWALLLISTTLWQVKAWTFTERIDGRVMGMKSLRRFKTAHTQQINPNAETSTKKDMKSMYDFIQKPMESTVGDKDDTALDADDMNFVTTVVQAADGRKADDIKVLFVGEVSTLTSVLIVLSGNSRPQNQAICAAITDDVEEKYDIRPGGQGVPEGRAESGWMVLDYGSVMVHIMTPKSRLFYNVEGQWKDKGGTEIDMSHVLIPNSIADEDNAALQGDGFVAQEDDPFWS